MDWYQPISEAIVFSGKYGPDQGPDAEQTVRTLEFLLEHKWWRIWTASHQAVMVQEIWGSVPFYGMYDRAISFC